MSIFNDLKNIIKFQQISKKYVAIILLFVIILASFTFLVSFTLQQAIDFALKNNLKYVLIYMGIFLLVSICYGFALHIYTVYKEKLTQSINYNLSANCLHKTLTFSHLKLSKFSKDDLNTRIMIDSKNSAAYLSGVIIPFIHLVLSLTIGAVYVGLYSIKMMITVIILGIILLLLNLKLSNKARKQFLNVQEINEEQIGFINNYYNNKESVKIYSLYSVFKEKFDLIFNRRYTINLAYLKTQSKNYSIVEGGILAIEFIMLIIGVFSVKQGIFTMGVLVGIWNASIGAFIYPLLDMPNIVSKNAECSASWKRVYEILSYHDIRKSSEILNVNNLVVDNISCKYESSGYTFQHLSFEVKTNEKLFIDGESGSGKTTLIKLLLGFKELSSGKITVKNGNKEADSNVANYISYVPQFNYLLHTSIIDNILMDLPKNRENIDKMLELISKIGLADLIESLPDSYNHVLTKDNSISVGQSQRIAILRAVMSNKPFIILDEPFSALDDNKIELVVSILNELNKGIIIVSHRKVESLNINKKLVISKGGTQYEKVI